uniref:Uncharacterized protein n=1 Tax=Anguilla anguilla TaxID=7936 RepID=A0A0E9PFQ9_ANGAN
MVNAKGWRPPGDRSKGSWETECVV